MVDPWEWRTGRLDGALVPPRRRCARSDLLWRSSRLPWCWRSPGSRAVTGWSREYDLWTRTTLDTLRGTLNSVRLHAQEFATEQGRIQTLQAMSESAEGRMQALQLGNMMAAEQLQQLVKLRQLVMAQINAQNVYMATQTNREAQRAATQSEWVRNGNADAPPLESTPAGASRGRAPRP